MPEPDTRGGAGAVPRRREAQINTSAGHVFDALRIVAAAPAPIGGTDVARAVGVPISTAHRALVTLEETGFVMRRDGAAKYRLGLQALELVAALTDRYAVRGVAQGVLRALSRQIGETVTLSVRLGWYEVCIDGSEGWQAVHWPLRLGERSVLHRSAAGRAMLSCLPGDTVRSYARSAQAGPMPSLELRRLREELRRIAEIGYTIDSGAGSMSGVTTLAFPVCDPAMTPVAALAVRGPSGQFRPSEDDRMAMWQELARGVESSIAAAPALFADPFGHLAPDSIVMSDPRSAG